MTVVIDCPRCEGKGYTKDYFYAVCTLGMAWLADDLKDHCHRCDGAGKIVKVLKEEE